MVASAFSVVVLLITLTYASAWGPKTGPTFRSRSGLIAGTLVTKHEPPIDSFKGIHFAEPPVNDLRWRAPRQERPWNGTKQATTFGHACIQKPNVFTLMFPHGISVRLRSQS